MESNFVHKVYDLINHFIYPKDLKNSKPDNIKRCPVTGLDISMQSKNTRFLGITGIIWYYKYEREIYYQFLATRLSEKFKNKGLKCQFKGIAHSIRNSDSNPRNNTKRAIQKLLNEKGSLFNNMQLIDKTKLQEAGMMSSSDS